MSVGRDSRKALAPSGGGARLSGFGLVLGALALVAAGCGSAAAPSSAPAAQSPAASAAAKASAEKPPSTQPSAAASAAPATTAPASAAAKAPTSSSAAPASGQTTVRIASLRGISDSGLFLATDRGYFAAQGIKAELAEIGIGSDISALVASDQLDVGGAVVTAGVLNAAARDIAIKVVADKGSNTTFLAVRKDLVDSGAYKGLSDLKGKKIGIPDPVSGGMIELEAMLNKGGLTAKDADVVSMQFPDQIPALGNKALDAAITIEPFVTLLAAQNIAVKAVSAKETMGDHQVGVLMYSPKFSQTDTAKRFMTGYVKGLRDYYEAFLANKQSLDDAAAVIVKYATVKDPALIKRITPVDVNPDGYLNMKSLQADVDWYLKGGHVQRVDLNKLVDNSFVDAAIQLLGRYSR